MLAPSAALAGKAQGGGSVTYSAAAKENNQLTIESGPGASAGESAVTVTEVASGVPLTLSPLKCHKVADTPPSVSCTSKQSRVTANMRDGDDVVLGSGSSAFSLNGGLGADRLRGSSADDKINGGKGDDILIGGDGSDRIRGSAGNDQIDSADNGTADRVKCGPGTDLVATDLDAAGKPIGDVIGKDCEQVVQKQVDFSCNGPACLFEDSPGETEPIDDGYETDCAAVASLGKSAKISKRSTKLKLTAPAASAGTCVGTLRMDAKLRSRKGKKVKKIKLGSASFSIAPGKSGTVKVKLTKRGAKLVKKFKRVRALVTVSTKQDLSGGAVISSRSVTLKMKKAKRARRH
jgi:Ca2+-binding RTX toxin-like protein